MSGITFPLNDIERRARNHAILCTTGFLILLPVGVLVARYTRTYTNRWVPHWVMLALLLDLLDKVVDCALDHPVPHFWSCHIRRLGIGVQNHSCAWARSIPGSPREDWLVALDTLPRATPPWCYRPFFQIPIHFSRTRSAQLLSYTPWPRNNCPRTISGDWHPNLRCSSSCNNRVHCYL